MNVKKYKDIDYSSMSSKAVKTLKSHIKRMIKVYKITGDNLRMLEEEVAWMSFEIQSRDIFPKDEIKF